MLIAQEDIARQSKFDRVIVRSAAFVDGAITEEFKHGFSLTNRKLTLKVLRVNVAGFMLKQVADDSCLSRAEVIYI